ncbi:VanZ family protein [Butyrivibrio sp. AD3002]|uniref:VanZ family protein n=1 Tax=Butyrivibrio sp. AD3002 TaxID=1280670 RepID=UPI0003B5F7B0|nr:VanZ family protein [Butyrivibrio sp. AD3002]
MVYFKEGNYRRNAILGISLLLYIKDYFLMSDQNIELFNRILEREFQGISLENQIMLLIIETCIVFIPGLILLIKKKTSFGKLLHVYLLVLYLGVILTMTIFRRPIGTRPGIVHLNVDTGFSFGGIVSYWSAAFSTLNTILFIPWGMIICPFFSKKRPIISILITTIIGAFTSLFIEITQLHTATGMFEATDIVTNTTGTFIGAVIMAVLYLVFSQSRKIEIDNK